jgi:hypothetical protein
MVSTPGQASAYATAGYVSLSKSQCLDIERSISSRVRPLVSGITVQTNSNCGISTAANKKKQMAGPQCSRAQEKK